MILTDSGLLMKTLVLPSCHWSLSIFTAAMRWLIPCCTLPLQCGYVSGVRMAYLQEYNKVRTSGSPDGQPNCHWRLSNGSWRLSSCVDRQIGRSVAIVLAVGNGRLVKGMLQLLVKLYYAGTRLNPLSLLNTHNSNAANITTCLHSCLLSYSCSV